MAMRPGSDCGACHGGGTMHAGAAIAGTIYPSLHEPENCWGTPEQPSPPDAEAGATVEITGANGVVLRVPVSYAGNFLAPFNDLGASYTARVSADGHTREMLTPQSNPSCNACHTDQGTNGAPGRILAP